MTTQTMDIKGLSPENVRIIEALIQQMSGEASVNGHRLEKPIDGMPQWRAKLTQERYARRTIHMYGYYAERYLRQNPKPTTMDIQMYLAKKLEEGRSPSYVENQRKAFRSVFKFLREEGLWHEDPTERVRKVKVHYGNRRCPTPEEVQKVLKAYCFRACDTDKMATLVRLIATTGLRNGEACSLRKDSIDWGNLELRIVGKGDKFRVVPLLPNIAEMLRDFMKRRPTRSPFVFSGVGKGGHAQIWNFSKTLRRACLRAGIEPFSPHGLRHFYATEMLKAGAKLEVVGRILGHASIGVTADIYRHVRTAEMHEEHVKFAPKVD